MVRLAPPLPLARSAIGLALLSSSTLAYAGGGTTLFVDASAAPGGDGTSWGTAYELLQDALADALASGGTVDEIWVASGVYKPGFLRTDRFELVNGVALYGGFAGGETDLSQRDIDGNLTILSGDVGIPGFTLDNAYHVLFGSGLGPGTAVDGFRVERGRADGLAVEGNDQGGGIRVGSGTSLEVRNCDFLFNRGAFEGGAAYVGLGQYSFIDCEFRLNQAGVGGGAMIIALGGPHRFERCEFELNSLTGGTALGGALLIEDATVELENSILVNNYSAGCGGAIQAVTGAQIDLAHCTVADNDALAGIGGAVCASGNAQVSFRNSLYGQNTANQIVELDSASITFEYSLSDDVLQPGPNVFGDVIFIDEVGPDGIPETGDESYGLTPESVGIDAGDNSLTPNLGGTDFLGNARLQSCLVDMGALEASTPGDADGDGIPTCIELDLVPTDLDGDGIPNYLDTDSDGDGVLDSEEGIADLDGDGIVNMLDLDSDDDGYDDIVEGSGDFDGDGIANWADDDVDNDGISDPLDDSIRLFVDGSVAGGTGGSWALALEHPMDALETLDVFPGLFTEIWIAGGTYLQRAALSFPGTANYLVLAIDEDIEIYGGFAGTESALAQRVVGQNPTILTSDGIDWPNNNGQLVGIVGGASVVLDGFELRDNGHPDNLTVGSGALAADAETLVLRNCQFMANELRSITSATTTIIEDCEFVDTGLRAVVRVSMEVTDSTFRETLSDSADGGGLSLRRGSSVFPNPIARINGCSFIANRNEWESNNPAGGLYLSFLSAEIHDSVFAYNVGGRGPAIGCSLSSFDNHRVDITGCSFVGNEVLPTYPSAAFSRVFYGSNGDVTVSNSLFALNSVQSISVSPQGALTVDYSLDSGAGSGFGSFGSGNLSVLDAMLVDPLGPDGVGGTADDDYSLQVGSPAVDRGDSTAVPAGTKFDVRGYPRKLDVPSVADGGVGDPLVVDIGAFETGPPAEFVFYGCGVNPPGSLTVQNGTPTLGNLITFGVDNPTDAQTPGSIALIAWNVNPDPLFPCGLQVPGWGMSGPGAPGENLLFLTGSTFIVGGAPWLGAGQPVSIDLPIAPAPVLIGFSLFVQGLIADPFGPVGIGLTEAVELKIGE